MIRKLIAAGAVIAIAMFAVMAVSVGPDATTADAASIVSTPDTDRDPVPAVGIARLIEAYDVMPGHYYHDVYRGCHWYQYWGGRWWGPLSSRPYAPAGATVWLSSQGNLYQCA